MVLTFLEDKYGHTRDQHNEWTVIKHDKLAQHEHILNIKI